MPRRSCAAVRLPAPFPFSAGGFLVEPTILADVDRTLPRSPRTEIFGPVLTVHPSTPKGKRSALANGTGYDAATRRFSTTPPSIDGLNAGTVQINSTGPGPVSPASPFGGIKQSGYAPIEMRHAALVPVPGGQAFRPLRGHARVPLLLAPGRLRRICSP